MAIKEIKGKILNLFKLQFLSLQETCFKVLTIGFNDKGKFILNLKCYGNLVIRIIMKSYWKYIQETDLRLRT